jgi:hypothetical protein
MLQRNYWRHKIRKAKESDRCDLCKALQIPEGRFTTDDNLLPQTLGHIQHECEALSENPIWSELGDEFPDMFNLCSSQTLENTDIEMKHPMTEPEETENRC